MNKTLLTSLLALSLCTSVATAQQTPVTTANYDLAERFSPKKINRMVHSLTITPNWFEKSDKFWYTWTDSNCTNYYIVDPVAKTKTAVFDLEDIAMQLTEITHDPFDAQHIPFKKMELKNDKVFTFDIQSKMEVDKKVKDKKKDGEKEGGDKPKGRPEKEMKLFHFEYDFASKKLTDVSDREEEKDYPRWANFAPDSSYIVFAKGYDLYYMDMENLHKVMEDEKDSTIVETRLTTDGTKDVPYGGSNYEGVEDRDTTKRYGVWAIWSPDSRHFLLEKYDMSGIKDFWVINALSEPRPTIETFKYQLPGEPGPKTYMMLFDMSDKTSKILNVGKYKDQITDVSTKPRKNRDRYNKRRTSIWEGTNDMFYLSRMSRDLHNLDICSYTIGDDSAKVLIHENLNTYIDVTEFRVVNNGKEIIRMSEKNGWSQLYLYGSDGTFKNAITKGAFHIASIQEIDEAARVVYFSANGYDKNENPYYAHYFRVGFDGSGLKMLDPGNFDHKYSTADDAKFFLSSASRVDTEVTNTLFDNTGKKVLDLETSDLSQLYLAGYKFPETFKVKAADGITDLFGVMYKPFDFDSTKIYPIIEYVYPGPQTEATNYFWVKGMQRIDRLAQMGFIVITVGNRGGHPDRSKWYHNFGYGNMRDYGLEDQKVAAQQLAARYKFIDINKVGIHGHSGGGFMSTAAILTYPDFYKVAVSCAGNHDNSIYNRWWSETHHGVKEIISEKDTTFQYSVKNNQSLAKNLKGHLLLVHGDIDNNVSPANTIRVVNALIRANKRFEMLILPGQRHGFGDMDEYFFWRMADFYSRYLIGDYENTVDIPEINND